MGAIDPCSSQSVFHSEDTRGYKLTIHNTTFDSANVHIAISLKYFGLQKFNYSVLVKVRLLGDSSFYSIPGILPSGDSFKFLQKSGNRTYGDTLIVTRRNGAEPLVLSEIIIFAFRRNTNTGVLKENRAFTKFILSNYVSHTHQPTTIKKIYDAPERM